MSTQRASFPYEGEASFKSHLAKHIRETIASQKATMREVEAVTGLRATDVSSIVNFHLDGFSIERLLRVATRLGCDVTFHLDYHEFEHSAHPARNH